MLLLNSYKTFPQSDKVGQDLLFKNQIKFSVAPVLYDNLQLTYTGERLLKTNPCISFDVSLLYYQHIKSGYGLNIGAGLTMAPYNLHFKFKSPANSIFQTGSYIKEYEYLDFSMTEYVQSLWVFPLSVQKIFPFKSNKKYFYSLDLGTRLNIIVAYPYWIQNGSSYMIDDTTEAQLFDFNLFDRGKKVLMSYFIRFGVLKLTKKQNSLQCNFVINYSPDKMGSGWYKFDNLSYDNYGKVKENINFIGLEFAYGLTLSRRPRIK